MEANIQWFDPSLGTPVVSISRSALTFNRAAVVLLGSPSRVEIGVDARSRTLVVRDAGADTPTEEKTTRGLVFCRPDSDKPFVRVSSKELVRFIEAAIPDFSPAAATRYLARPRPASRDLIVDLRQPVETRAKKRE